MAGRGGWLVGVGGWWEVAGGGGGGGLVGGYSAVLKGLAI